MTDLRSLTIVDMDEASAYAASRFHATVEYDCPVWSLKCPSGMIYRGLSFAEACGWAEIGEPASIPQCCHCDQLFDFENPWQRETDSYFHSSCFQSAQAEMDQCRMEAEFELWSGR